MPKLYVNILGAKDKFKRKLRDKQPADDTYDEHSDSAGSYGAPDGDHVEGSARGIERLNSHRPSSAEIVPPPQHQHSSQGEIQSLKHGPTGQYTPYLITHALHSKRLIICSDICPIARRQSNPVGSSTLPSTKPVSISSYQPRVILRSTHCQQPST